MTQPESYIALDDDVLLCPQCLKKHGEAHAINLHHTRVTVFTREKEDGPANAQAIETGCEGLPGDVRPDYPEPENPSSRRDGIVINFECETCGMPLQLLIAQHKGSTLIKWA